MGDKRVELAATLVQLTDKGRIDWEVMSDNKLVTSLGSGRIVVSKESTGSGVDIVIRVYNQVGNIAEEFSDVSLNEIQGVASGWYTRLDAMMETGRRKALGADELLESIIRELNDGPPF